MQVLYYFTNRHEGFSKGEYNSLNLADYVGDEKSLVDLNKKQLGKKLNIKNLCFMKQVHGDKVKIVTNSKTLHECDAIITKEKNLALCVLTADCIPVLLFDKKTKVISAIHAGRAGVFKEIVKKTVDKMSENFNSNPNNITAFVGNCIHQCCYEINGNVLKEAKEKYPLFVKNSRLDILSILLAQLKDLGVNVINKSSCTSCDEKSYSYRRDKVTGRNAGIIMLRDFHD